MPLWLASHAAAQDVEPPAVEPADSVEETSPDDEARDLFGRGRDAFEAGRYEEALGYFEEAYRVSNRHLLLFNIGQAQDRLRRDRDALASFERYLELNESPPMADQVRSRIRVLRESIARSDQERERLEERIRESSTPEDDGSVIETWWFWTLLGTAVVAGAATALLLAFVDGGVADPIPGDVAGVVRTLGSW